MDFDGILYWDWGEGFPLKVLGEFNFVPYRFIVTLTYTLHESQMTYYTENCTYLKI